MKTKVEKTYPEIGQKLYLSQRTGNCFVDAVKTPYTVIAVSAGKVVVQSAKCIFPDPCYYDTMPTKIEEDPTGDILLLNWYPSKGKWGIDKYKTSYPEYAYFTDQYEFYPYLN